jgi:hypothetical protein
MCRFATESTEEKKIQKTVLLCICGNFKLRSSAGCAVLTYTYIIGADIFIW